MTWRPGTSSITDEAWDKVIEYIKAMRERNGSEEPDRETDANKKD